MAHYETTKELVWSENWHDDINLSPKPPKDKVPQNTECELIDTTVTSVTPEKVVVLYTWEIKVQS